MPRVTPRPAFVTTLTDDQWNRTGLAERALHVARSQDAVKEFPKGSNSGPMVTLYLKVAGIFFPAAWCAAFVFWCLLIAGADKNKLPKYPASTYWWWKWAGDQGRLFSTPLRGRLGVYNDKSGGHIWFALSGSNPHRTLEGNTNKDGSREGYMVAERERSALDMTKHARSGFILIDDSLF